VRDVRILYAAKCDITNHTTGQVEELFLLQPCLGEWTIPKRDFFIMPSNEFQVIYTRTHSIPIAKRPSNEAEVKKPQPLSKFAATRFTTRTYPRLTRLATTKEVIGATVANTPMNGRTIYRDDIRGYTVLLEYPVRTMTVSAEQDLFQVNTGPVPLPDINTWDGIRPGRAFLAYVAFSQFDFAEFILRREVEPSDEDKKWLHKIRGKWRWELRDPKNPPSGHPPRPPWPNVYNETLRLKATNEFLCAEI